MEYYCNSSTDCYHSGICELDYDISNYICQCDNFLDTKTKCQKSIFDSYNLVDILYPLIFGCLFMFGISAFIFEMVKDQRKVKLLSIVILSKFSVIIFSLSRISILIIWLYSSIAKNFQLSFYYNLIDKIGIIILIFSDILLISNWFESLLRAKHIDLISNKIILTSMLFKIGGSIITPLSIILLLIGFFTGNKTLEIVSIIIISLLIIITSIISMFYIRIVYNWIHTIHNSTIINKILFKTKLIGYSRIIYLFIATYLIATKNSSKFPEYYIIYQSANRFLEIVLISIMFLILENNTLRLLFTGFSTRSDEKTKTRETKTKDTKTEVKNKNNTKSDSKTEIKMSNLGSQSTPSTLST